MVIIVDQAAAREEVSLCEERERQRGGRRTGVAGEGIVDPVEAVRELDRPDHGGHAHDCTGLAVSPLLNWARGATH